MQQEPDDPQRRRFIRNGLGAGALAIGASALPQWLNPVLAQGEELLPFLDIPESFAPGPLRPNSTHMLDLRKEDAFYTDDFYVVQHYGQPDVDPATWRLKITGLVDTPLEYTLEELRQLGGEQQDIGFECGGNGVRMFHGLIGNARWRGVKLADLLQQAGVQPEGREVVFFGADIGSEEIRGRQVETAFARSLSLQDALREENLLAFEMNGQPLPVHHGKPLRLLVPGHYGVANVKWLTQIHIQDTRFMGRFMGRDYVTLKRENLGGEERWVENSVARMNLKSVITRVTRIGNSHRIHGFAINDGTPLRSVEVRIDEGPWLQAEISSEAGPYTWKPFSLEWPDPPAGEHRLVSRVTDINGHTQAPQEELPERVSYWEEFGQFPRRVLVG